MNIFFTKPATFSSSCRYTYEGQKRERGAMRFPEPIKLDFEMPAQKAEQAPRSTFASTVLDNVIVHQLITNENGAPLQFVMLDRNKNWKMDNGDTLLMCEGNTSCTSIPIKDKLDLGLLPKTHNRFNFFKDIGWDYFEHLNQIFPAVLSSLQLVSKFISWTPDKTEDGSVANFKNFSYSSDIVTLGYATASDWNRDGLTDQLAFMERLDYVDLVIVVGAGTLTEPISSGTMVENNIKARNATSGESSYEQFLKGFDK